MSRRKTHGTGRTHQTAHASVGLDTLPLVPEVLSRGLRGACQQTTHHDRTSTERKGLHDVSDIRDTAVSDHRDTKLVREFRDGVHGGSLRATDRHNLLGDTNRAGAHAHAKTIRTSSNEARGLLAGDDIAGDDLELGVRLLDPPDHLDLEDRVALRGVEDDDVEAGFYEERETLAVRRTSTNCGSSVELLALRKL